MRRTATVIALTAAFVGAAASGSSAKGSKWTVSVALDHGRTAQLLSPASAVWEQDAGLFDVALKQATAPAIRLGPAYAVAITGLCPNGGRFALHQTIYPYPVLGPWTYTPAGQTYCGTITAPVGWFAAPKSLYVTLTDSGMPPTAPVRTARVAAPFRPHSGSAPWLPIVLAVVGLAALLAVGGLFGRSAPARGAT